MPENPPVGEGAEPTWVSIEMAEEEGRVNEKAP
jgi:hypothetical protein